MLRRFSSKDIVEDSHDDEEESDQDLETRDTTTRDVGGVYELIVQIVQARQLRIADRKTGSSDPFVEIKVRKEKKKTKVIKRSLNPEWNEEFRFGQKGKRSSGPLEGDEVVTFTVFDEDTLFNDTLGKATFQLADLNSSNNFKTSLWLPIKDKSRKKSNAELYVSLELVAPGQPGSIRSKSKSTATAEYSESEDEDKAWVPDSVLIKVLQAKNLLPMDKGAISDPYCQLIIGKKKQKTTTKKKNLNPRWDEEFEMKLGKTGSGLTIKVFDADMVMDDLIGQAQIPLDELTTMKEEGKTIWVKLEKEVKSMFRKKTISAGEVELEIICFSSKDFADNQHDSEVAAAMDDNRSRASDKSSRADQESVKVSSREFVSNKQAILPVTVPEFKISVISARNLNAADKNGFSDPYCILKLGKEKRKSKTVNKTLNPDWNETFSFAKSDVLNWESTIDIIVYDADFFSSEELGKARISLRELFLSNDNNFSLESDEYENAGSIQLKAVYDTGKVASHMVVDDGKDTTLQIIRASGLKSTDRNGKCDPYCVVSYRTSRGKRKSFKTNVVNKTLDPKWTNQFFQVDDINEEGKISFEIRDKDLVSSDLVGKADIDAHEFLSIRGLRDIPLKPQGILNICVGGNTSIVDDSDASYSEADETHSIPDVGNGIPDNQAVRKVLSAIVSSYKGNMTLLLQTMKSNFKVVDAQHDGYVHGISTFNRILMISQCNPVTGPQDQRILKQAFGNISLSPEAISYEKFCNALAQFGRGDSALSPMGESESALPRRGGSESALSRRSLNEMQDDGPRPNKYTITIFEADGLKAADRNGKSDPYVVVSYSNSRGKSKSVKTTVIKKTLEPKWDNATFELDDLDPGKNVQLKVFDKDLISSEVLGSLTIDASQHMREPQWIPLNTQGRVRVQFLSPATSSNLPIPGEIMSSDEMSEGGFSPAAPSSSLAKLSAHSPNHSPYGGTRGTGVPSDPQLQKQSKVFVKLIRAENLAAADRNGTSDPYCVVHVGKESHTTKVIRRSRDPKWNESFIFCQKKGVSNGMEVRISVMDKDTMFSDNLGHVVIPIEDLRHNSRSESWYPLQGHKKAQGRILVVVSLDVPESTDSPIKHGHHSRFGGVLSSDEEIEQSRYSSSSMRKMGQRGDYQSNTSDPMLSQIRMEVSTAIRKQRGSRTLYEELAQIDRHHRGYLPMRSLNAGLQSYGVFLTDAQWDYLMPRIDPEGIDKGDYKLLCKIVQASFVEDERSGSMVASAAVENLKQRMSRSLMGADARGIKLETLFAAFDEKHTGLLSDINMVSVMGALGSKFEEQEIAKLAQSVPDCYDHGYVNYVVLVRLLCPDVNFQTPQSKSLQLDHDQIFARVKRAIQDISKKQSLTNSTFDFARVFDKYDAIGSGKITKRDFRHLIENEINKNLSHDTIFKESEILCMINRLDRDGDNMVDYATFLKLVSATTGELENEIDRYIKELMEYQRSSSTPKSLRYEFGRFDTDGTGMVSRREFRQCLEFMGVPLPSVGAMKHLMQKYDTNGTLQVAYEKFLGVVDSGMPISTMTVSNQNQHSLETYLRDSVRPERAPLSKSIGRSYEEDSRGGYIQNRVHTAQQLEKYDDGAAGERNMWHPNSVGEWLEKYASPDERNAFKNVYQSVLSHSTSQSLPRSPSKSSRRGHSSSRPLSPQARSRGESSSFAPWVCKFCRHENYSAADRDSCGRCGAIRSAGASRRVEISSSDTDTSGEFTRGRQHHRHLSSPKRSTLRKSHLDRTSNSSSPMRLGSDYGSQRRQVLSPKRRQNSFETFSSDDAQSAFGLVLPASSGRHHHSPADDLSISSDSFDLGASTATFGDNFWSSTRRSVESPRKSRSKTHRSMGSSGRSRSRTRSPRHHHHHRSKSRDRSRKHKSHKKKSHRKSSRSHSRHRR